VRLLRRKRVAQDRRIAPRARMRRPTGTHRRRARCRIGPEQPSARRPARDTRSASTSSRKADVDADVENPTQVLRSTGRRQPSRRRRRARFSPTGVTTSLRRRGRLWCGGATMSAAILATSTSPTGHHGSRTSRRCRRRQRTDGDGSVGRYPSTPIAVTAAWRPLPINSGHVIHGAYVIAVTAERQRAFRPWSAAACRPLREHHRSWRALLHGRGQAGAVASRSQL
jgi:hypothetical protein